MNDKPDPPFRTGRGDVRGTRAAVLFYVVLVLQIGIPAWQLGPGGGAHFAWRMFDTVDIDPWYAVEFPDGRVDTVAIGEYVARPRSDIDLPALLPAHLCGQFVGASKVLVRWPVPEVRSADRPCR